MEFEHELLAVLDEFARFERQFKLRDGLNLFEAVGMVNQEIKHSRFLGFLLDPSAGHGLGDRFLHAVLDAALVAQAQPEVPRLKVAIADCSDAAVFLERDHFDVSVDLPGLNLLFVIENKIGASESEGQLEKYRKKVQERYGGRHFLGAFLTREGYAGEDSAWSTLSYQNVVDILVRLLQQVDTLTPAAQLIIGHYLELIGKHIVVSNDLIEACRKIYAKHRAAIDLIVEHGQVPVLAEAFAIFSGQVPTIEVVGKVRPHRACFVPTGWRSLPHFQIAGPVTKWEAPCPPMFWFRLADGMLELRLEVGPFALQNEHRVAFVQALRGVVGANQKNKIYPLYTRVKMVSEKVADDLSIDDIAAKMADLWKKIDGLRLADQVTALAHSFPHGLPEPASSSDPESSGSALP